MRNAFRAALVFAGLGLAGIVGCQQKGAASGVARPAGIEKYVSAMQAYNAGDKGKAMSQLVEATKANPDLIMPRVMLGDMYKSGGDYQSAAGQYEKVVRADPYYASNYYNLGVVYQFMERLKDAASQYQKALQLKPTDAKSNMNLGSVYMSMGNGEEAVKYATKATEMDPKSPAAWSNLGVALETRGDYVKAENAYRKSIDLDPDNANTLANLGTNLLTQKKFAEAAEVLKRAASIDSSAATRTRYADALSGAGKYKEALEQYQQALKQDPKNVAALNALGFAQIAEYRRSLMLDDSMRQEAVASWNKSLAINPNQPKVKSAVQEWGAGTATPASSTDGGAAK